MAAALSLSFTAEAHKLHSHVLYSKSNLHTPFLHLKLKSPLLIFPKSSVIVSSSTSQSQSSSSSSVSESTSSTSTLLDPLRTGCFLSNEELEKLKLLKEYKYFQELKSGSLLIRVMRDDEMDMIVGLLAESFGESMLMPMGYLTLLGMLVKQYLIERRALMPHTATLIAYYKDDEADDDDIQLAGTVEVSFDKIGANDSPPTPNPPKASPYLCNMTVKKSLRRKGIGWHLLKASEELICQMSLFKEVYLHCRIIDNPPFSMYTKAGYDVIKTDNIFVIFKLQRRKHLMRKQLPLPDNVDDDDASFPSLENPS